MGALLKVFHAWPAEGTQVLFCPRVRVKICRRAINHSAAAFGRSGWREVRCERAARCTPATENEPGKGGALPKTSVASDGAICPAAVLARTHGRTNGGALRPPAVLPRMCRVKFKPKQHQLSTMNLPSHSAHPLSIQTQLTKQQTHGQAGREMNRTRETLDEKEALLRSLGNSHGPAQVLTRDSYLRGPGSQTMPVTPWLAGQVAGRLVGRPRDRVES
ncbi:unnamed protein product [Lampetra fluviatilis]